MNKRIHVIAPFHTVPAKRFSWCAFTGKALRFPRMMRPFGWEIIEYANEGSESEANEHVVMLSESEYAATFEPETQHPGRQAQLDGAGYALFNRRLKEALLEHAEFGDIVAYTFGPGHTELPAAFPGLIHVESGIGYPVAPYGCKQIYESYSWRSYQSGRFGNPGGVPQPSFSPVNTYIVPNYYDVNEWPFVAQTVPARVEQDRKEDPALIPAEHDIDPYVLFMNRFVIDKGIELLTRIIKLWCKRFPAWNLSFKLAGMGDYDTWLKNSDFTPAELTRIERLGVVTEGRAALAGNALCALVPSIFEEPFGGSAVETMLTGTPVLATHAGAFVETIEHGATGFLCRTADDYVRGISLAAGLDRKYISDRARRLYSLETCGAEYDRIFTALRSPT